MKHVYNFIKLSLLLVVGFTGSQAYAQCVTPIITTATNNGPVLEGDSLQLTAIGSINGVPTTSIRMCGIGANRGTRGFNQVFSSGDRQGYIHRWTDAVFNQIFPTSLSDSARALAIRKSYDVLLYTFRSDSVISSVSWGLIEEYLKLGGSVFFEDPYNIKKLAPGVVGVESNGAFNCNYVFVNPAPFPALIQGATTCFTNHHLALSSWPSWMSEYIKGPNGEHLAVAGVYPGGRKGRLIVQSPDQDYHAVRNSTNPVQANQYTIILNQVDFLVTNQTGFTWTGPNGFTSQDDNPIIPNFGAANAGTYTATLTNYFNGGCSKTATTTVTMIPKAGALNFDGNNDYVQIDNAYSSYNKEVTVEWWGKVKDAANGAGVTQGVQNMDDMSTNVWMLSSNGSGAIEWRVNDNGTWRNTGAVTIDTNWHHFAGTAGPNGLKLYIDGTLASSGPGVVNGIQNVSNSSIALGKDIRYNGGRYMEGDMDEVRIWSRELCLGEIQNNMNCELNATGQTGLIGLYHLNLGYATYTNTGLTTAADASGNGNDGTLNNFSLNGSSSNWSVAKVSGNCGAYTTAIASIAGNGNTILNGDVTPSTGDNTDFGTAMPNTPVTKTYTITNTNGGSALKVSGINFTGSHASAYSVSGMSFPATIAVNGSATFTVIFNGSTVGMNTATVNVENNDCDDPSYTFAVQAEITCAPAAFTSVPANINDNTAANSSNATVTYNVAASGTPAAQFNYVFTGATTGNGSGTGTGSVFNVGTTNVKVTATNACSMIDSTFTITIVDNQLPSITAPVNVTANTDAGMSSASGVTLGNATATDNVGIATITNDAPSVFLVGTTTVTWTATDVNGNTATATQVVTIVDNEDPVISAPASVTANTDAGQATASGFSLGSATATDNVGTPTVTNNAPLVFPIGTTTVTWTATDANGNTATATQIVTVLDNQAPSITAPAGVIVNTDAGLATASGVSLGSATGSDNDGIASITNDAPSVFPIGTTTVTWTATDNSGNTTTATQAVTVVDNQAPSIIAPANVTANTDAGLATASGVSLGSATASDNDGMPTVTNDAPSVFPIGTTTVTWTATDASGNITTATQAVTVIDNQAPVATAPANVTANTDAGQSTASGVSLGSPIASDNDGVASITNNSPSVFPIGTTVVTWTITDNSGNTVTVTQTVTVIDNQAPSITAPASVTANTDAGLATASGVSLGSAIASDNDGMPTVTNNAPSVFPIGTTVVTWTATDNSGNTTTATQTVTVVDNQAPSLIVPANVTANTDAGLATASGVSLGSPVASDNDGTPTITNNAPSIFPIGTTIVTWTATDASGNTTTATQAVTVIDNQAPVATAPANVTANTDAGQSTASGVSLGSPVASDNDGVASITNNAPSVFPIGTTVVTWTITDNSGNTVTVTQTVTVIDNQAPIVTPPADVTVNTDPGMSTASGVSLGNPSATDNDGIASVTNNGPSVYSLGTTTVTWTVKDNSGNTTTGTQKVTVIDNQAPSITAPANVTASTDAGQSTASGVSLGNATATDNDGVVSITNDAPSVFPVGTTVVTWTAKDASGNTATATQTVTISDNEAPVAKAKNYTLNLNGGSGIISPSDINNGCSDNVGIASITVSPNSFTCADAGLNTVTLTVTDVNGNSSTATATVLVQYSASVSTTITPGNNTYTGGNANEIYLGYGPQNATITATANGGTGFTYSWTGAATSSLSSTSTKSVVFTPTAAGSYTFYVTATNSNGCSATSIVTFCVYDIRVFDKKGRETNKVYLCHVPPGNNNNPHTLSVSVNAVASHLSNHSGDRLGSCDISACGSSAKGNPVVDEDSDDHDHGIANIENAVAEFKLYPNPNSGTFNLELPSENAAQIVMTSISGQVVYSNTVQGTRKVSVRTDNLTQGVYMLHVTSGNDTYHTKVFIQ